MAYRCPECWHYEVAFESELLDELFIRDKYAAIFDSSALIELLDWAGPVHLKADKINADRTIELIFKV